MNQLVQTLSWDLSPLRPWEYWQQDAREWEEAQALRRAWHEGEADASDELASKNG